MGKVIERVQNTQRRKGDNSRIYSIVHSAVHYLIIILGTMAIGTIRRNSYQFFPSPSFALGILFLLVSLQWKPSHTLVNTVPINRRKLTKRCWLHLFQSPDRITSDIPNELSIENDSENDPEQFGGVHYLH